MENPILTKKQFDDLIKFYNEFKNGNIDKCPPWRHPSCIVTTITPMYDKGSCTEYFPKMISEYIEGWGYLHRGCPCDVYSHKYLLKRLRDIIKSNKIGGENV